MELNRSGRGIPVETLAGFAFTANQFLGTLGEDLGLDRDAGRWVAYQFGSTSLRFTAEFIGPVEPRQVEALEGVFHGATLLRLATLSHLADLGDSIHEDEIIGFGLYKSDGDEEPAEWLAMTRWRAMKIREDLEARVASGAQPQGVMPASLLDRATAQDVFGRRAVPAEGEAAPPVELKALAEALAVRVGRVEAEVSTQRESLRAFEQKLAGVEQGLKKMLHEVDRFCQAVADRFGMDVATLMNGHGAVVPLERPRWRWAAWAGLALACLLAIFYFWPSGEPAGAKRTPPSPVAAKPEPAPPLAAETAAPGAVTSAPAPAAEPAPAPGASPAAPASPQPPTALDAAPPFETAARPIRVEVHGEGASWITVFRDGERVTSRLLDAGQTASFEAQEELAIRLGNAGNVIVSRDHQPLGPGGKPGQTRLLKFTRTGYENLPVQFPIRED
jgi:hypothetical protein